MARLKRNPEGWTLRRLIQNTYTHRRNRYTYRDRDVLRRIRVERIHTYDGKDPGEATTKFQIRSFSYPQYRPYFTGRDKRGRDISRQRSFRHQYEVIIQLGSLSLDDDRIKLRTGADRKWDFSKEARPRWKGKGRNKKFIESKNVQRGIMADFWFRCSWLYKQKGILYGRNWANGPPLIANPQGGKRSKGKRGKMVLFLDKHMLRCIEVLVNRGIIQ